MFPQEYRRALQEQAEADAKSLSSQMSHKMEPITPSPVMNGVNEEIPSKAKQQPVQNGTLAPVENSNKSLSSSSLQSSQASTGSELGVFSDGDEKEDFVEDPINPLTDVGSTQIKVVGNFAERFATWVFEICCTFLYPSKIRKTLKLNL